MTSEKGCRKDKNQNIQVFVRLRPLNQRERDLKSIGVVDVVNGKEVVVRFSQQTNFTKKFTFDKTFGPNATQVEVYQEVVSPLIEEVLAGYNCTVFAYGQTGTGKTHTMVGEHTSDEICWQKDPLAGIIPRALSQLFDELRISNTEYTVRVSYLELYNEELFDLLSTSEDNSKLRIYEDVTRKGSNIVNGLEEITVYNKKEVYRIMAQGQERKRVASTLMNAQSSSHIVTSLPLEPTIPNSLLRMRNERFPITLKSRININNLINRSHTVFTIVIHMKENSPEGEELMKIGKLNLVDLAGSENISKAGSDNPAKKERARECVNINQSLLTLGRVITALVERHPHVPYRESKLTRILQESLGGRTKTSIIATVSPGHKDLEETLSTLEYAHRAKNIQNKPEINQKMTKKAILKEYVEEIDRLKRDLQAARDKSGVYLANETYAEMNLKEEEQRKEIQELLLKKRAMEEERDKMESVFSEMSQMLKTRDKELNKTMSKLQLTRKQLSTTSSILQSTRAQCEEQEQLVQHHGVTEQVLSAQARELLATADVATHHVTCLHDNVDKRRSLESANLEVTREYREQSAQQRGYITAGVDNFSTSVTSELSQLETAIENYVTISSKILGENEQVLGGIGNCIIEAINETKTATNTCTVLQSNAMEEHQVSLDGTIDLHQQELKNAIASLLQSVRSSVETAEAVDIRGNVARFVEQWYNSAAERVTSVRRSQTEFESRLKDAENELADVVRARRETRRAHARLLAETIQNSIAHVEKKKEEIDQKLSKKMEDIEIKRREAETRLDEWAKEKRRLLEEELARHSAQEKAILENTLKIRAEEIQEERAMLEETMSSQIKMQQDQYEIYKKEMETAEMDEETSDRFREKNETIVSKYGKMFDEGVSAISIDMDVFSRNVVEVVEHVNNRLLEKLSHARDHIESDAKTLSEATAERCTTLSRAAGDALRGILDYSTELNQTVVHKIELNNTTTVRELNELAASTAQLMADGNSHLATNSAILKHIKEQVARLHSTLAEAVETQAELEGRYLAREYRLYSPTGKTPSRTEYRYPRTLAATSPHETIIARLRALRLATNYNDPACITVESDSEAGCGSDCESSLSEEFLAPSPPTESLRLPQPTHAIVKCTSETDIYNIRKRQDQQQRGKENSMNSIDHSSKKPSKLPSLTAHKRPLIERNGISN